MSQQCCNAMLRWAKNRRCESSRVTSPLRRITFKPGKFANFKVLFSVVSTDFPSLVYIKSWKNRRGRVSSARDLWVQVPIPFFSEKRNFHAVRPHKKRNLTNLTNRALSWNGTVKWPKYISRVHVKVGAREIATVGEFVTRRRGARPFPLYVSPVFVHADSHVCLYISLALLSIDKVNADFS